MIVQLRSQVEGEQGHVQHVRTDHLEEVHFLPVGKLVHQDCQDLVVILMMLQQLLR